MRNAKMLKIMSDTKFYSQYQHYANNIMYLSLQ